MPSVSPSACRDAPGRLSTHWEQSRPSSGPLVTGFSGRGFKVDGEVFRGGVTLTPLAAQAWDAGPLAMLTPADLETILDGAPTPEILLLGTGASLSRPPRAFTEALEARGIGVEAMDSRAAARAWAVLRAEDRWIVAALMAL